MKVILIGAAIAALGVPALAQLADGHGMMHAKTTRAEAEAKARAKFAERDTNHDGFITPDEIRAGVEARMSNMRNMAFDRLDTDHNGTISREEFAARRDGPDGHHLIARRMELMTPDMVKDGVPGHAMREMHVMTMHGDAPEGGHMMMMADSDRDGRISQAEAVAGALKMFDRADANHDGTVTPEERGSAMEAWGAKMHEWGKHMEGSMGHMPPPPPPAG